MRLIDADALKEMKFSGGMRDDIWIIHVPFREVMENIENAPTIGGWISVKDSTPTVVGLNCWIMIKGSPNPIIDCWEGDRGEESAIFFPDGVKTFVKSGWYYNACNEVTHWMPIRTPEPPEEVSR